MIFHSGKKIKNGKVYIGKTKHTLIHRMKEHLRNSKNPKTAFHHTLAKYGHDEFEWKVIYKCKDINELNTLEVKFISEYNSHRNSLSEAQQKWLENNKHPFKGKTQTDEAKERMKRAWEQRVEKKCPHCNKVGKANMKRYHFDNCKYKNE